MKKFAILLLACASSLFAQDVRKGIVCFGSSCKPVSGAAFDVEPAATERRFVWTSNDGATSVLGTLAANAKSIDIDAKDLRTVTLSLQGDARRGWPLETRISVAQSRDHDWRWSVPSKVVTKPLAIRMAAGMYSLQVAAEHHSLDRHPLEIDTKDIALNVRLNALPVITGRVITLKKTDDGAEPKEVPVAGAQVTRDAKPIATTNEQGTFRAELADPPIKEILVTSAGLASKTVPLTHVGFETDLGTIALTAGVKLTVHLERGDAVKSKTLHAELSRMSRTQWEHTNLDRRDVAPTESDVVFTDLADGEYYFTLSGDGALEHLTTTIRVKSHDEKEVVHIEPFQLAGTVALGSDPVRDGKFGIQDRTHTWNATAPIDADGHFTGTMWQREDLSGWVTSSAIGTLPVDGEVKLEGDPAPWDVRFRNRLITGHVLDEETKDPIARATLDLQLEIHETPKFPGPASSRFYTSVPVGDDGSFSIVAVHDGIYDLSAKAPDHAAGSVTIEVATSDESKRADLLLSRGVEQLIEFAWPSGEPIQDATIIEGTARDGHNPAWMANLGASGVLKLRIRPNDKRTLFILPRGGSFAAVHVIGPSAADAKPMHVIVPPPSGALVAHLVDAAGKPARGGIVMTYNGEPLPASVVMRLRTVPMSAGYRRIDALPAGAYELWGARVMPGGVLAPPAAAPVRVGITAGEQPVEIVIP